MPDRAKLAALLAEGEQILRARHEAPGGLGGPKAERTDKGYRVERPQAKADADAPPDPTKLYIYSDIGGWFGVWPEDVIAELAGETGDIELHLHSPGGDAFDGIAIFNAFKDYDEDPARGQVNVEIDGLAASAASVIAMAGRKVKMKRSSQIMIHDAWGYAVGPAEDMESMRVFLDKISESTAEIYAEKAGGTAAEWRTAMKAESWYRDREAVEAGLADEIQTGSAAAKNQWDLKVFNYAGRDAAPTPPMPGGHHPVAGAYSGTGVVDLAALEAMTEPRLRPAEHQALDALQGAQAVAAGRDVSPAQAAALIHAAAQRASARTEPPEGTHTPDAAPAVAGPSHTEGASTMPVDRDKIREALGLGPDATKEQVDAAYAAAFSADPVPTPPAAPGTTTAGTTTTDDGLTELARMAAKMGVTLVDSSQIVAMQAMAAQGKQAYDERRREQRDAIIQMAIDTGRIELSRKDHWVKKWDGDPEGTRLLLESLAPNLVPMSAAGYTGTVAANEAESRYFDLYPEDKPGQQGVRR